MTYSLRILPAADADVDAAADYIAQDNLDAALRFYDAVSRTYRELSRHPKRWPVYKLDHPRLADPRRDHVVGKSVQLLRIHRVVERVEERAHVRVDLRQDVAR